MSDHDHAHLDKVRDLWEENEKYRYWLKVERAATIAFGTIPVEGKDMPMIPSAAVEVIIGPALRYDTADIDRYERDTHHDVTAFLRSLSDSIPAESAKWLHYGLTSSDVVDTAQALRMKETLGVLIPLVLNPHLRRYLEQLRVQVGVGQLSGPVGTHATVPVAVEDHAMKILGLRPVPVSSQIIGRDVHAEYAGGLAWIATVLARITNDALVRDRAALCRSYSSMMLDSVALWHERDISHSSVERIALPGVSVAMAEILERVIGEQ